MSSTYRLIPIFLMVLLTMSGTLAAATVTWDGDTNANWSTLDNWDTGSLPGATTVDIAVFDDPALVTFQPTLDVDQPSGTGSIQRVDFLNAGWTLGGSAVLTIDINNATPNRGISSAGVGTNTINADVVLFRDNSSTAVLDVSDDNILITNGTISQTNGNIGLNINGGGTWVVRDLVTVADLRWNDGIIEMDNASGNAFNIGFEVRLQGDTLRWMRDNQIQDNKGIRLGDGVLIDTNGFSDTFDNISFGNHTTDASATVQTNGGLLTFDHVNTAVQYAGFNGTQRDRTGTGVIDADIQLSSSNTNQWRILGMTDMSFAATPTEEVQANGVISGAGGVTLQGDGMLELNGANTYTGDTIVEKWSGFGRDFTGGTLLVNGNATAVSSGTGLGTVQINETGTLGGSGTIGETGRVTLALSTLGAAGTSATAPGYLEGGVAVTEVANLANVAPGGVVDGERIATLNVNGNVDFGDYTRLAIDLDDLGISDQLAITGDWSLSSTGSVLDLDLLTGSSLSGDYILASFASLTGTFDEVYYDGVLINNPTAIGAIGGTHNLVYDTNILRLNVIPEPASLMLLSLGAGLLLTGRRKH